MNSARRLRLRPSALWHWKLPLVQNVSSSNGCLNSEDSHYFASTIRNPDNYGLGQEWSTISTAKFRKMVIFLRYVSRSIFISFMLNVILFVNRATRQRLDEADEWMDHVCLFLSIYTHTIWGILRCFSSILGHIGFFLTYRNASWLYTSHSEQISRPGCPIAVTVWNVGPPNSRWTVSNYIRSKSNGIIAIALFCLRVMASWLCQLNISCLTSTLWVLW